MSESRIVQKVITVGRGDGQYYNFFNTPNWGESLAGMIRRGWVLKFIKDDSESEKAVAVFERIDPKHD